LVKGGDAKERAAIITRRVGEVADRAQMIGVIIIGVFDRG